jgi:hypothetical protein
VPILTQGKGHLKERWGWKLRLIAAIENRWDQKARLLTGCQVIDVVEAQIRRRPAMKKVSPEAAKQINLRAEIDRRTGPGRSLELVSGGKSTESRADHGLENFGDSLHPHERNGRHEETRTPDLYRVKVAL